MRAGKAWSHEKARNFMMEAGTWQDRYDHHVAEMCMLIVWGGLYVRLIQEERDNNSYLDGPRLRYLMRRKDWADDMILVCEENLTTCGSRARDLEMKARIEWERAEGRESNGKHQD